MYLHRSSICSVGEVIRTKFHHFRNWLNPIMENISDITANGSCIGNVLPATRFEDALDDVLIFQNHIDRMRKFSLVFVLPWPSTWSDKNQNL